VNSEHRVLKQIRLPHIPVSTNDPNAHSMVQMHIQKDGPIWQLVQKISNQQMPEDTTVS